jgi:hypothetical protein
MGRQAVLSESRAIPRVARAVKDAVGRTDTQQMQVAIQHGEAANRNGEDLRKFLEPAFDPGFAVLALVSEQERPADAACDAVIPA